MIVHVGSPIDGPIGVVRLDLMTSTAIRWERRDYTDGASEILTLCKIDGDDDYVIQITSGLDAGDDFVGLYDLDGEQIPLGNNTWEIVCDAPAELIAEIEQNWESGTTTVNRVQT